MRTHRVYILDKKTEEALEGVIRGCDQCINTKHALLQIDPADTSIEAVFILMELDWEGYSLQSFHGLAIATELRRKNRLLCPIVFLSSFPNAYFEKWRNAGMSSNILFGRGTGFIELHHIERDIDKAIESTAPLSPAVLADMNEMLLDKKGYIIDMLTHDLKFGSDPASLKHALSCIASYFNAAELASLKWDQITSRLTNKNLSPEAFQRDKGLLIFLCEQQLDRMASGSSVGSSGHKLIILEDDPEFRARIVQYLSPFFGELLVTGEATRAMDWIIEDEGNEIVGILSDWRLYGPDKRRWQVQGYEVLSYAAYNHFIALFSLTSEVDWNVHNVRNLLGLEIQLFKKQHLYQNGTIQWEMIADIITQKCNEIRALIDGTPTGKRWKTDYYDKSRLERVRIQSLHQKYTVKRNTGWRQFDADVSRVSDELWNYYKVAVGENLNNLTLTGIKDKFGLELKAKDPQLEAVLSARRLFLALWFHAASIEQVVIRRKKANGNRENTEKVLDENPLIKIYCIANGTNWELLQEDWDVVMSKAKSLAFDLCIEPSLLPNKGILPEEKSWLKKIHIDISAGNSTIDYLMDEENDD